MNQQTRISDKSLARLIADADKVLDRNTPVADEEWWQDFRAAMLELQARRRADSAESVVNTGE
ncbi:hypothetical protein B7980_22990 [Escherichia coli]|uniref:hypothetical protein n=1 Tax=Escherichia coli TaxID=562 RepID=UPI000A173111|nr:hypothetical protein [Escherichia coli]OSC16549.1 hypothetical protein B7980_22990 [Escherichia coli]